MLFFKNKKNKKSFLKRHIGFTLLELLVVIAIIGILSSIVVTAVRAARRAANVVKAGHTQRQMIKAVDLYFDDMAFYPPDVNRGWDPGFVRSLPWNADAEAGDPPPGGYASPGTNCSHCPSDWQDILATKWNGPYLPSWPRFTSWLGKYDYNYWGSGATRYGCVLPAGVYTGVQGDYTNNNKIPLDAEQKMIAKNFDNDGCENGESQMLLHPLS